MRIAASWRTDPSTIFNVAANTPGSEWKKPSYVGWAHASLRAPLSIKRQNTTNPSSCVLQLSLFTLPVYYDAPYHTSLVNHQSPTINQQEFEKERLPSLKIRCLQLYKRKRVTSGPCTGRTHHDIKPGSETLEPPLESHSMPCTGRL